MQGHLNNSQDCPSTLAVREACNARLLRQLAGMITEGIPGAYRRVRRRLQGLIARSELEPLCQERRLSEGHDRPARRRMARSFACCSALQPRRSWTI